MSQFFESRQWSGTRLTAKQSEGREFEVHCLKRLRKCVSVQTTWEVYLQVSPRWQHLVDCAIRSAYRDCVALGLQVEADRLVACSPRAAIQLIGSASD